MAGWRFWEKATDALTRKQTRALRIGEHEVIDIMASEQKIFNQLWTDSKKEREELLRNVGLENTLITQLKTIGAEIVRLEDFARRFRDDVNASRSIKSRQHDREYIKAQKKVAREETMSMEEIKEAERLALDVHRKLMALKPLSKQMKAYNKLGETTARKIGRLITSLDKRMNVARKEFIDQIEITKLKKSEEGRLARAAA